MVEISGISAVVTDIEGTTSSIKFVHEVLFPYARQRLPDYVQAHADELQAIFAEISAIEGREGLNVQEITAVLLRWMDEDRKAGPLKELQGRIWRSGYESGALKGDIYPDAVAGLQRWRGQGLKLYVYSSGSVEAQKLIFGYTSYGDLVPWFSGFFDTGTGAKLEAGSYTRIAVALGLLPKHILFLSDHLGEIEAAGRAGMQTVRLMRDDPPAAGAVASFADIAIGAKAPA